MKKITFGDIKRFALSNLRVLETGSDSTITKSYLLGQKENTTSWSNHIVKDQLKNRNILSVHSTDQGLTILDPGCWNDVVEFFKTIEAANETTVESQIKSNSGPVKVIAYLNFV